MIDLRVAAVLVATLIGAAPAAGANTTTTVSGWTVNTDELAVNTATGAFSAPGHVTMTRTDGSIIQADRAGGNYKSKQAALFGHVSVHDASGTFGTRSAARGRGPATLTTDELRLDNNRHLYDALGNVHYEQADTTADAQMAHLNDVSHQLDLTGSVHVVQGRRTLDAQRATYNTLTGDGEADGNVTLIFPGATPSIATPKPIKIP